MAIFPTGYSPIAAVAGADRVYADDGTANGTHTITAIAAYLASLTQTLTNKTITAIGAITSSHATAGIGYATGAGGVVTQATSKSTGVTLNKIAGQITTNNALLAGSTSVGFTLTNSAIAATDVVNTSIASGASVDSYRIGVDATAAGSCRISIRNVTTATALGEAIVINFAVMKSVAA